MKRLLLVVVLVVLGAAAGFAGTHRPSGKWIHHLSAERIAAYPTVTIHDIQFVSSDSLKLADSLGYNTGSHWTSQVSRYMNDTVNIVALVTVPYGVISYTAGGTTLGVVDTGALGTQPWGGVLVRYPTINGGVIPDTDDFSADGFYDVEQGDIIEMQGIVQEFPTTQMNSLTQFAPIVGTGVNIISSDNPLPPPVHLNITDFNIGSNPGGKIMFSTGEQWESQYIYFTNVTVVANVNTSRGTFMFSDASGNQLSDYDWSYHFTKSPSAQQQPTTPADTAYHVPPALAFIDTIRGYVATSSGGESGRGYRICPMWPGDIVYGPTPPGITTSRRYPVMVPKDSTPLVTVKAYQSQKVVVNTYPVASVQLFYSANNGSWQSVAMTAPQVAVDSTYQARIPVQPAGTVVRYFFKVTDTQANASILANSGGLTQYDTSKGFFFYKSLDRSAQRLLTIHDIQYNPYVYGRSPYVGAVDSTGGIVTADSSCLLLSPLTSGGTNAWYIQSGNQPYSGLWVTGPDSILEPVANGDSVVVTGQVYESFDVTQLEYVSSVRIVSHHNPIPSPVKLLTSVFGPGIGNGNLGAEPYEGMLVEFDSCRVGQVNPVFVDPTEFEVNNSGAAILVRRDGRNFYSNVPADTASKDHILKSGDFITKLVGIIYYNNNNYMVVPRTNADYVVPGVTSVGDAKVVLPAQYALDQNYPNPFNPSTTIRYSVPAAGKVTLKIYNVLGQEVATLVNTLENPGTHAVTFDASRLASGVYFYRITSGAFVQAKKMLLLK
ncbi:MAG TPA: T9SS type A sorting domain-containing protein [Bacteroidota bacterium]|nr:T9SS type A sorting domain-containing protein [Bacteroidota bacterium]